MEEMLDRALLQFLTVAEEGSITKAAAALFVTQPTLTFNMRKLEEAYGVALFERSSRGVVLTPYGQTLYDHVVIMRRLHNNAVDALVRQKLHREQSLSIGSGYSWWTLFLKQLLLDHSATYPDAQINILLGSSLRCMDQLLAGDISLFVGHKVENLATNVTADFVQLGSVIDGYFVREGHPLLSGERTQSDIRSYPWVLAFPPESRHHRFLVEHEMRQTNVALQSVARGAFTSDSLEACLDFVSNTEFVLRHTSVMAEEFRKRGLLQVPMQNSEQPPRRSIGIYVLPERRRDPRIGRLIQLIKDEAGKVAKIE